MENTTTSSASSEILVIDDDHGQLRTLSDILESENLAPICCPSGHEALHACTEHDAPVAILDLRLPDIDGLELLEQLLQKSPDLKVIIHTGYASLESAMGAINYGAFAYVQKLSNIDELLSHVHRAFHMHWATYSESLEREAEKRTRALTDANEALCKSEERFRGLLEGSIQGFLVHRNFHPLYVNPAFAAMLGYDAPEDLYALGSIFPLFAPHEHERMRQYNQARLQQRPEVPSRFEIVAVHQNGAFRWLESLSQRTVWKGEAAVQSMFVDVTACKQAETDLRESEERLRAFAAALPDAAYILDEDGRYFELLTSQEPLLYRKMSALQGRLLQDVIPQPLADRCLETVRRTLATNTSQVLEYSLDAPAGHRWFEGRTSPLHGLPGSHDMVVWVARDITDRKRAEEARQTLEGQLRQAQKMEAMGVLAGGIAHEFNNILGGIIGFADLIRFDAPPGSDVDEHAQLILQAGRRAKELVQQILTFSHRGQPETRQAVSVTRVIQEGLRLIRASLPSTIAIHSHFTQAATTVWANTNQLSQVLLNLCANAEHAMRGRGGRLDIQVDTCALSQPGPSSYLPVASGSYTLLRVSDTGCGMPQEVAEHIFEPFFTTKPVGEGVGLGLSVVYSIIESHHGAITVESQPGVGTTVVVYLPTYDEPEAASEAPQRELPHGQGRILVVDDEAALVRFAQRLLERLGYKVAATTSSVEALDYFRLDPQGFDAILTDQTMPQITGEELARAVRELRADIPIILCSGYSQGLTAAKLWDLRIDAFCMKPLGAYELANTLHRLLSQRRG